MSSFLGQPYTFDVKSLELVPTVKECILFVETWCERKGGKEVLRKSEGNVTFGIPGSLICEENN